MKKYYKSIVTLAMSVLLLACTSTAPITGRSQLKLVDDEALIASSVQSYHKMIQTAHQQGALANHTKEGKRLIAIGKRVSAAVEQYMYSNGMGERVKNLKWEYNLIQSKEINAFAMPGGKIAFYSGIFPVLQTDAGIAYVMGHEIGHVVGGHHAEGASNQQVAGIASLLTGIAFGQGTATALVNQGLSLGLLKYNRTQEYEADKYGMIFMAMAGYNPAEAIAAETRMASLSGGNSSDFTSTHPSGAKRIQALKEFLPEAMKYYKK